MQLRIKSPPHIKQRLYNFKKADWDGLKHSFSLINWDLCFEENDINACLTNWSDTYLTAVNKHIPTNKPRNVNEHPWIDHELLNLVKVKNKLRKVVIKPGSTLDHDRFRQARRLGLDQTKPVTWFLEGWSTLCHKQQRESRLT